MVMEKVSGLWTGAGERPSALSSEGAFYGLGSERDSSLDCKEFYLGRVGARYLVSFFPE